MSAIRTGYKVNEDLELEDLFEIITPGTIERRIHTLDDAWQQLYNDNKDNAFIKSETAKWNMWAKKLLDSWTDRFFSLSAQRELDNWSKRYKAAYDQAKTKNAPGPDNIIDADSILSSPVFWTVAGVVLVIGIYLYGKGSTKLLP